MIKLRIIVPMLTLLLVFTGSPANAATVERTVTCPENVSGTTQYVNPGLNLSAVPGDVIRVTFVNCETRKLWGGNGNGMFLNPTTEFQTRAGWNAGSRTWNLPNTSGRGGPLEGTVIEFELMSSANSGTVPFAPSVNLMVDFGGAHGPLMWWRMAASVGPTVLPALSPATQTLDAYFGFPIAATPALSQTGLTAPVTYASNPSLPAGLILNTSTGVITGTIAAGTTVAPTYTIRGVAANNQVATSTLSLTASTPAITTPTQNLAAKVGVASTPTSAIQVSGLFGSLTHTISPSLPAGLTLNSSTGVISGTPTAASQSSLYTLTVGNGLAQATTTITIGVADADVAAAALASPASLNLAQTGFDPSLLVWVASLLLLMGSSLIRLSGRMMDFRNLTK